MNVNKFRLDWRNSPAKQIDALQEMVKLLANISNSLVDIGSRLDILPVMESLLRDNNTLSQLVVDNTNCTCNALHDISGKLDNIISIISEEPAPAYSFVFDFSNITLTDDDIAIGYFDLPGHSRKDGVLFNSLLFVNTPSWSNGSITVLDSSIRFGLKSSIPAGISEFTIVQSESGLVQNASVYYEPTPVYALFYALNGGSISGGTPAGNYVAGRTITLPSVSRPGYTFKGFSSSRWSGNLWAGDTFVMPADYCEVVLNWLSNDSVVVSPDTLLFDAMAGALSINVSSSVPWSVDVPDSWVSLNKTSGNSGSTSVVVTPDINDGDTRSSTITFTAGSAVAYLRINQDAAL